MSSDYNIICVSHDPAIVIDYPEWGNPEEAIAAAIKPAGREDAVGSHVGCDLLVGRWSGAMVEVCCLGWECAGSNHRTHARPLWTDYVWLRLLLAAHEAPHNDAITAAIAKVSQCWPYERIRRFRHQLGMEEIKLLPSLRRVEPRNGLQSTTRRRTRGAAVTSDIPVPTPMPEWLIEGCKKAERFMREGHSPLGIAAAAYLAGWDAGFTAGQHDGPTEAGPSDQGVSPGGACDEATTPEVDHG